MLNRTAQGFATWTQDLTRKFRTVQPGGRLSSNVRQAELEGLAFAFRARCIAITVVVIWLIFLVPWPRDLYYGAFAGVFFLLGYIPYRLRRHRYAEAIKLGFVLMDVALITTAILLPPPVVLGTDWPVQTRLRGQDFLYLLLLLGEAALTYSPRRVIWTGLAILSIWSVGVTLIYSRDDTLRFVDMAVSGETSSDEALRLFLSPNFVGLTQWHTQLVGTFLFTVLITMAVWRSRVALFSLVQAEVVRRDLARYVSPDVAEALAARVETGFGEPTNRIVAVMFADIVGFTKLTDATPPEHAFSLLRGFQERSCAIVFRHGGTLDKYLGDGFMATFGATDDHPDPSSLALACAFDLKKEMEWWNVEREQLEAPPVRVSIGVHSGKVLVGNLGSDQRIEFTVVGDVVNVASRLEETTRELGCTIVASEDCVTMAAALDAKVLFRRCIDVKLRGSSREVRAYLDC